MRMTRLKRIVSLLMTLTLLFCCNGCGISLTEDIVKEIKPSVEDIVVAEQEETVVEDETTTEPEQEEPTVPDNNQGQENTTSNQTTGGTTVNTQQEKQLSGELSIQIFINENHVGENAWMKILDDFEKANPNLKLTTYVGPNVNTQLASRWTSGKGTPDVVLIDGKGLSEYSLSSAGSFMDLTSWYQTATVYGSNEKIWNKVNTNAIEKINNKQYKAPLMLNAYGLMYDQTNYQKLGLTVHSDFNSLLINGSTLAQAGQKTLIYPGMYSNYLVWGTIMPAVAAYGQDFFNRVCSADPSVFTDQRFVGIMNRLSDLAKAGYISASATQDHLGAQSDWLNHRAALVSSGMWLEGEMKNSIPGTFKIGFTTAGLNAPGQTPGVALMGVGVAISSKTQNEENAKTFLRYLYQDEPLKELAVAYGYASISKNTIPASAYTRSAQQIMTYVNSSFVTRVYKTKDWGVVGETFNNVANQIAQGTLSVEDGCKQLEAAARKN